MKVAFQCFTGIFFLKNNANFDEILDIWLFLFRFMYFWSSYPKAHWTIKSQLADLMMSLGFVKTALDLYLDISHWRAIVACYNVLELKHKVSFRKNIRKMNNQIK